MDVPDMVEEGEFFEVELTGIDAGDPARLMVYPIRSAAEPVLTSTFRLVDQRLIASVMLPKSGLYRFDTGAPTNLEQVVMVVPRD
jgi:hypothetical protein